MADYDLRIDVPARAFINAQLASLIEKGGTFFDAKSHLFSLHEYKVRGLNPYNYPILDQSAIVALLYCTIVVPREFLNLPQNHRIYQDFDAEKLPGLITVIQPNNIDSYGFLRCLRNSVAHALFSISEGSGEINYEFWTDRNPLFRAKATQEQILKVVDLAGKRLINAVLENKRSASSEMGW